MSKYYKFVDRSMDVLGTIDNRIVLLNNTMLNDVKTRADIVTPTKNHILGTDIRIQTRGHEGSITWNSPYAQYQERGSRADGSHKIQNYTTPGTGPGFAKNTISDVWKEFRDYYRKVQSAVPPRK